MTNYSKIKPVHHWDLFPKAERTAKVMPKHFRGHNPAPLNREIIFKQPANFTPETKGKLFVVRRKTPYNSTAGVETHHGVKMKNVNRVLSRCNRHVQVAAFMVAHTASGVLTPIKIYG